MLTRSEIFLFLFTCFRCEECGRSMVLFLILIKAGKCSVDSARHMCYHLWDYWLIESDEKTC